jgi:hypothetical protein
MSHFTVSLCGLNMERHGDVESAVLEFVIRTRGARRNRLTLDTTLLGDLGVDGDDADDFFVKFAEEFHVSLSALNLSKHFGGEGCFPWQIPLFLFRALAELLGPFISRKTPEERAGLVPVTIRDLVAAAKTGKWAHETPCIPSRERRS